MAVDKSNNNEVMYKEEYKSKMLKGLDETDTMLQLIIIRHKHYKKTVRNCASAWYTNSILTKRLINL